MQKQTSGSIPSGRISRRLFLGMAAACCMPPCLGGWTKKVFGLSLESNHASGADFGTVDPTPAPAPQERKPVKSAPAAVFSKKRLFGTVEFRSKIKNMPKWERVLQQVDGEGDMEARLTRNNRKKEAQMWLDIKNAAATADMLETAKAVNHFFNRWPYRTDVQVYGLPDYWATPEQFIKSSGDCEDYAIAKFYAMKELGVPDENHRIVVLKDKIRNLDHAIMALYIGEDVYILDNMTNMVHTHEMYKHYQPYFSVNEEFRWAHVPPSR